MMTMKLMMLAMQFCQSISAADYRILELYAA